MRDTLEGIRTLATNMARYRSSTDWEFAHDDQRDGWSLVNGDGDLDFDDIGPLVGILERGDLRRVGEPRSAGLIAWSLVRLAGPLLWRRHKAQKC